MTARSESSDAWSSAIWLRQLGVLVAVGEVGGGVAQDVREGPRVEYLLQQAGVLHPVGVHHTRAEGLSPGIELRGSLCDLLLQHVQRLVQLLQLVLERLAARLDPAKGRDRVLDLLA